MQMGLPNEPTFLVPSKKLTHGVFRKFGFLKDHRRFWAKKRGDKVVNISFSQESLDCVVVRKPLGFLPVRSKTANAQGSSLTFRNPFSCDMCGLGKKNKKVVPGWWVYPKFIINLPSVTFHEYLRQPPVNRRLANKIWDIMYTIFLYKDIQWIYKYVYIYIFIIIITIITIIPQWYNYNHYHYHYYDYYHYYYRYHYYSVLLSLWLLLLLLSLNICTKKKTYVHIW